MSKMMIVKSLAFVASIGFPTVALAQTTGTPALGTVEREVKVGAGADPSQLPPPRSDNDPRPTPPAPVTATGTGITEQAGVGGTQAYARAGVLELGGSMGVALANKFTNLNVSPSLGWFFINNVELSAIVGFNYAKTEANGVTASATYFTGLVEPSVHIPFSSSVFGFAGVGAGLAYVEGPGAGFAVAPRLGINALVGRSGILTPSLNLVYATTDAVQTPNGATVIGVSTTFGANVGYTAMW